MHGASSGKLKFYFNPRSPWGERPSDRVYCPGWSKISIHAPRGGATFVPNTGQTVEIFQSTLPVGGATKNWILYPVLKLFQSTLPVGGATLLAGDQSMHLVISIHAPRGGSDPPGVSGRGNFFYFNPRSPWGERLRSLIEYEFIHHFNPRSPWGERLFSVDGAIVRFVISIHAPRGGATLYPPVSGGGFSISIHAPRGGATILRDLAF